MQWEYFSLNTIISCIVTVTCYNLSMIYKFIGWSRDEKSNIDKVWVCLKLTDTSPWSGSFATVWGRRSKKLQYLVHTGKYEWDMDKLINAKEEKGYNKISQYELSEVYPEFENDLRGIALWATLGL